jgi:hypothetical protein
MKIVQRIGPEGTRLTELAQLRQILHELREITDPYA